MNAFTQASRGARFKLDVAGLGSTLRAPDVLHRVVMDSKPDTVSVGDFALKAMLDSAIDALKVRGEYRAIQRLLGAVFGLEAPSGTEARKPGAHMNGQAPDGNPGAERHPRRSA